MAFQVSPGVNVREFDFASGIPSVSTSVGCMAAHLRWGPVGKRVLIGSEDDLVANFFTPDANTYVDFLVAAQYLSYSNQLYVTRVVTSTASGGIAGADGTTARNATASSANTSDTVINNDDDYENNYSTGISNVGEWVAKYPGELGNSLKVSVCASANAWQSTLTGTANVTSNSATVGFTGASLSSELTVGDILLLGPDREQHKVLSIANSTTVILETRYAGNSATGLTVTRRWEYFNEFSAAPGTSTYVDTRNGSNDELHVIVVDEDGEFTNVRGQVLEKFAALSQAADAKTDDGLANYYKDAINQRSRYIWWAAHNPVLTNAGSMASGTAFNDNGKPFTDSLVNGRDGAQPSNSAKIDGYNKFANPDEIDVSFIIGSNANQTVALKIIDIIESRKDCVATFSSLQGNEVNNSRYTGAEKDDIITFRNTLGSTSYGVFSTGWKWTYDKYNDKYRYIPTSGDVAGLMARTDLTRDPWYSPAGYNRGVMKNVVKLAYNPTRQLERDELYKAGINPVLTVPGHGTVLFGDKTMLGKESPFEQIGIRRLFIVLEKAIATAAKFMLFEFNDDFTRTQFVNMVEPFLRDVQGRRGIEQFAVKCDEQNNPIEVRRRKEFIGSIFIVPNYSINFITLNFVAVNGSVQFEEKVGVL